MCYSVAELKYRSYRTALREGADDDTIQRLKKEWEEIEHLDDEVKDNFLVSGFAHPLLHSIILEGNEMKGVKFHWGLIPHWVKDMEAANKIMNQTINARGESIFEKPSFRDAAKNNRCLILVDGFYEYHHKNGKKYPHFVERVDGNAIVFAGLWSEWTDKSTGELKRTASIVTTEANEMMAKIHNNPKANGARMPLILEPEHQEKWLDIEYQEDVKSIIKPLENNILKAHTVRPLLGKKSVGDVEQAKEEYIYQELNEQGELF